MLALRLLSESGCVSFGPVPGFQPLIFDEPRTNPSPTTFLNYSTNGILNTCAFVWSPDLVARTIVWWIMLGNGLLYNTNFQFRHPQPRILYLVVWICLQRGQATLKLAGFPRGSSKSTVSQKRAHQKARGRQSTFQLA